EGVVAVGFAGHHGSVVAADDWGEPPRRSAVPPAPAGTHEDLLRSGAPRASLLGFPQERSTPWLSAPRAHRAIGVVYHPDADHRGNWVPTVMGGRYDALLSFDRTEALRPLHAEARAEGELETYPSGTCARRRPRSGERTVVHVRPRAGRRRTGT